MPAMDALRRVSLIVAAIALAIAAGACSPSSITTGSTPTGGDAADTASGTPSVDPTGSSFGATMIDWLWLRESTVASCMHERGFDYVAHVPNNLLNEYVNYDDSYVLEISPQDQQFVVWLPSEPYDEQKFDDLLEEAATEGFGVFTFVGRGSSSGAKASEDPNVTLVSGLGPDERTEYFRALQGYAEVDIDADGHIARWSASEPCLDVAAETAGPEPSPPDRVSSVDNSKLWDIGERVHHLTQSDPAMTVAESEYAACLEEGGAPADPARYMRQMLGDALERATGSREGPLRDSGLGPAADLELTFGEALPGHQDSERTIAVAYFTCLRDLKLTERQLLLEYQHALLSEDPEFAARVGYILDK